MPRTLQAISCYLLVLLAGAPAARAQELDPERVTKVKAAFVLNFIKYTQWPAVTFVEPDDPIIVGFLGATEVDEVFDALVEGQQIDGRPIRIVRLALPATDQWGAVSPEDRLAFDERVRRLHVLFVAPPAAPRRNEVLDAVRGAPVLTIGDTAGFTESGGMLELVLQRTRIAFEANVDEIRVSGIAVSAHVLKLARIVETQER